MAMTLPTGKGLGLLRPALPILKILRDEVYQVFNSDENGSERNTDNIKQK